MSVMSQFRVPPHHPFTGLPDPDRSDTDHYGEGSQMHHSAAPQGSCFGLPYQDHNYGAPPPPTPPPSPPPPTRLNGLNGHLEGVDVDIENVSLNTTVITSGTSQLREDSPGGQDHEDSIDDSITRCICDYVHDDGYMICCDRCSVWQHVDCMGVDRANIPEIYYCERCEPRKLNKQRAVQLQTRKREVLMIDTSATESENETKQFAEKTKNRKKKIEKREMPIGKLANGNRKTKKFDKDGKRKQGSRKSLHQSNVKKSPAKVNKLKSVRSPEVVKEEGTSLPWHSKQYADTYEEAPGNVYSPGVQDLLYQTKVNGVSSHDTKLPLQLQAQVCGVSQFSDNQKGLEALDHLALGQPLIEYKGNVMLRDQYNNEKFFFQRFQPHVLFYPNIANLDLCIDASTYGNEARHVRRSCSPNAEVRHFLDGNQVYFYIFTTKSIPRGYEITIPFDFSYQECNYFVECACSKPNCLVEKFHSNHRGITTNTEEIPLQVPTKAAKKQKKIPKALDEPLHIDIGKVEVKPSMTSPPTKRRRLSSHNASKDKGTPVKDDPRHSNLVSPKTPGLASPQFSGPSDHEGEDGDRPSKKMSREDRKLAAIMKAFEKLEKQQERKKESQPFEVEVKAKPKARVKVSKPEQRGVDIPPSSPPLPPPVKGKEKKEKLHKETRKTSIEKRRASKPETVKPMESEVECEVKEELLEEKPVEKDPPVAPSTVQLAEEEKEVVVKCESPVKEEPPQDITDTTTLTEDKVGNEPQPPLQPEYPTMVTLDTSLVIREDRPRVAKGKKKRGGSTPARRKSRVNSSVSTTTTDSADDEAISSVPPTPNTASSLSETNSTPQTPSLDKGFKFPKTKKHLMSEWLSEKTTDASPTRLSLSGRVEPLEISVGASEAEADFVKCVPSPHTNSLSHLRRSSVSNASSHTRAVDSIPGVQLDTNLGSAKKRWLRQAMFERSTSVPAGKESNGSNTILSPVAHSCSTSPAVSPPVDFVTPLKKRRFARESLCKESPYGQAPSTPTHPSSGVIPPEEHEYCSPHSSSLDRRPQFVQQEETTATLDANKNGICINNLNNFAKTENIFEKIGQPNKGTPCDSVASFQKEQDTSHYTERKLLFDKQLSVRNRLSASEQEQSDLNIGCSQGFEISDYESATDSSLNVMPNAGLRTLTENESEAASTSECDYHKQLNLNTTGQIGSSECSDILESSTVETNCEKVVHRSGKTDTNVASPKHSLNVSGDNGLISDQEKTCSSSSLSESILQDSMCNSFDSTESMRGQMDVDSSQGIKRGSSQDVISMSSDTSEALHKTESSKIVCSSLVCVDSSRDHKCLLEVKEENVVDSLTESNCAVTSHSIMHISPETSVVSSVVDSVGNQLHSSSSDKGSSEDNTVSCSSAQSSGEAEARVVTQTEDHQQQPRLEPEEGEMPSHSTNADQTESEKEEGEITTDDDEEMVDSSSVIPQPCLVENDVDTNEAENVTDSENTDSSNNNIPQAYRQENNQGEVTSSRSTSPYWDNCLYRKRGWWRQKKDGAPKTPPSNHSSPSTAESPRSHQLDSKSEDICVDSTTERTSNGHSPIVSSSDTKLKQEAYGALDISESLSPGTLADSLTSPLGFGYMSTPLAGKKKVSLLEYRKRMKQKSYDGPSVQVSTSSVTRSNSSSSNSSRSTPSAPTTPLYPNLSKKKNKEKLKQQQQHHSATEVGPKDYSKKKKEEDLKWSATATMAERVREQTHITLTERLRKEFGLDTVDDTDEKEESDDDEPPPPPPPPPAPPASQVHPVLPPPTHAPPPLPPHLPAPQTLSNLSSIQAQSLIHQTMLAVANSAQPVISQAMSLGQQPVCTSMPNHGLLQAQTMASLQMLTTVSSTSFGDGATASLPSSSSNPALIVAQNPLHLPPAPPSSTTSVHSQNSVTVASSQLIHPTSSSVPSQQQVVTAIGTSTVLNNNNQTQPLVPPKPPLFLPLQTQPHQFNHLTNNVGHPPQLAGVPQPSQDLSILPPVQPLLAMSSLLPTSIQPSAVTGQGLLPTPAQATPQTLRVQQNSADTTGIPSLLAIPTMPTKIFNRLAEESGYVALEQGAALQDMEYISSGSAPETSLPETHKQQPQLLVNYNHGFPQTGINLHK